EPHPLGVVEPLLLRRHLRGALQGDGTVREPRRLRLRVGLDLAGPQDGPARDRVRRVAGLGLHEAVRELERGQRRDDGEGVAGLLEPLRDPLHRLDVLGGEQLVAAAAVLPRAEGQLRLPAQDVMVADGFPIYLAVTISDAYMLG